MSPHFLTRSCAQRRYDDSYETVGESHVEAIVHRWPHIHFEVYASLSQAVAGQNAIRTSQLALPEASCREVYAQTALYPSSTSNLNSISLASDNVFSNDGGVTQLASVTGSIANGYEATLEVGVAVAPPVDTGMIFSDGFE